MSRWLVGALVLAGCAFATSPSGTTGPRSGSGGIAVPNLVGKSPEDADATAKAAGFTLGAEASRPLDCDADAPRLDGTVSCQQPSAGEVVPPSTMIVVAVHHDGLKPRTDGEGPRNVPTARMNAMLGRPIAEAQKELRALGFRGEIEVRYDESCKPGLVCAIDGQAQFYTVWSPREDDRLSLTAGKTVDIAAPPPE